MLLLANRDPGAFGQWLATSDTCFVPLLPSALVEVLTGHPPRIPFIRRIRERLPLSTLNPYIYRGPIAPPMFHGRQHQLERLCELDRSYYLVGPRASGKTSLMNRAHSLLREAGQVVVRVEMSPALDEMALVYQIIDRFVRQHGADPILLKRCSIQTLERLVEDLAVRWERDGRGRWQPRRRRTVGIYIDEADELESRCRTLAASLRHWHDEGWARILLVGYKGLRKAVSNIGGSVFGNLVQPMELAGLSQKECGGLITGPMTELGVTLHDPQGIVEVIHRQSGGSPSRIQLLCHFLVESLEALTAGGRALTPEIAAEAINLVPVRKVLGQWFFHSTTPYERWLAAVASFHAPCSDDELVAFARADASDLPAHAVRGEIHDLLTANVLDYRPDGRLDFSFPAMKELARPPGEARDVMAELRRTARSERGTGSRQGGKRV